MFEAHNAPLLDIQSQAYIKDRRTFHIIPVGKSCVLGLVRSSQLGVHRTFWRRLEESLSKLW